MISIAGTMVLSDFRRRSHTDSCNHYIQCGAIVTAMFGLVYFEV
jgi:hypothetical protein